MHVVCVCANPPSPHQAREIKHIIIYWPGIPYRTQRRNVRFIFGVGCKMLTDTKGSTSISASSCSSLSSSMSKLRSSGIVGYAGLTSFVFLLSVGDYSVLAGDKVGFNCVMPAVLLPVFERRLFLAMLVQTLRMICTIPEMYSL